MLTLIRKLSLLTFIMLGAAILNVSHAADAPKFDCTLTDQESADKTPGPAKDTFTKDTPVIYLACSSDDVKKGQIVKAAWIAADTNNVAPANYKIDEKSIPVSADLASDQDWDGNFSLSKPNNGWPVGSYHVDLYVDNNMVTSVKFSVK